MRDWYRLPDGAVLHATDVVVALEEGVEFNGVTLERTAAGIVVTAVDPTQELGAR